MAQGDTLAFPESVIDLFSGKLGQMEGGFPAELSALVLKGRKPLTGPPGEALDPVDFEAEFATFKEKFDDTLTELDFLSYEMYPDVFRGYYEHQKEFGEVHYLPTHTFFYGLKQGDEILVKLQRGKPLSSAISTAPTSTITAFAVSLSNSTARRAAYRCVMRRWCPRPPPIARPWRATRSAHR